MIDFDLRFAHAHATQALKQNRYWDSDNAPLTLKSWADYAAIIAPAVSFDTWERIYVGVVEVKHLNEYRELDAAHAGGGGADPPPIRGATRVGIAYSTGKIYDALMALAPLHPESLERQSDLVRSAPLPSPNG